MTTLRAPRTHRPAVAILVLAGALAAGVPVAAAVRYAAPSAAAGAWFDQPPPDVAADCGAIELRLPGVANARATAVEAILAVPDCRQSFAASIDSATMPTAWRGVIEVRSGRTLVALRPGAAPGSPPTSDSLTLWLSANGCQLSGVRKSSGAIQVAIFRKPNCPAATPAAKK